jgi:hypothetical protein
MSAFEPCTEAFDKLAMMATEPPPDDLRAAVANADLVHMTLCQPCENTSSADQTPEQLSTATRLLIDPPDTNGTAGAYVVSQSVSTAWITAFGVLMRPGVASVDPLVVTVTGLEGAAWYQEHPELTSLINRELYLAYEAQTERTGRRPKSDPLTVATAANTIFPQSLWFPGMSRHDLYAKYLRILPRLRRDPRNRRGIYFERMISYGRGPEDGNQVEHIFRAFEQGVKRTSAYQVSIADPRTDLTKTPFLGFPCLQQIAIHPSERTGTLSITGFYGTQYLFERGYGNFLGLCRLGNFLSAEMGLRLTRMTCVASHAPVESLGKARGRALVVNAEQRLTSKKVPTTHLEGDLGAAR